MCRALGVARSTSSARTARGTGAEAHAAGNVELERYMHLYALNRGILLTPFHNMALMSPATTEADVDRHTEVFHAAVHELAA
jgi:glutamate-1-semialdehyde 2,1-aminomutase